jgi:hypothetical protein
MVIVKLYGGLGNQLLQYAIGRRISVDNNVRLKLDASTGFQNDFYKRKYSLSHFNILENFASPEEIAASTHIREKHFHFDPDIFSQPNDIYLDGYWQSEKYFESIKEIIRKEFSVKQPLKSINLRIANEMAGTNSVCVHFRRLHGISDGKVDARAVNMHGAASLDYYYRCVEQLTQTVKNPHFFIVSDDPEWVRDNLKLPYPTTLIDHNGADKDYEDLRLMSLCKHDIIANSTFSWWGAWLNPEKDKIVFVPERWFNTDEHDTKDLIPDEWIRISVSGSAITDVGKCAVSLRRSVPQEVEPLFKEAGRKAPAREMLSVKACGHKYEELSPVRITTMKGTLPKP